MNCNHCAEPLEDGTLVCPYCATAQGPEQVQLVLPVNRVTSLVSMVSCYAVFFDARLIIAYSSPELEAADLERVRAECAAKGASPVKTNLAMMRRQANFYHRYESMRADEILPEDDRNGWLPYRQLARVEWQSAVVAPGSDDVPLVRREGELALFDAEGNEIRFIHFQPHQVAVKAVLERLFAFKLHYQR